MSKIVGLWGRKKERWRRQSEQGQQKYKKKKKGKKKKSKIITVDKNTYPDGWSALIIVITLTQQSSPGPMEFGIGRGQIIITCAPHPSRVYTSLDFLFSFFSLLYTVFSILFHLLAAVVPVVSLSLKQSNMQIFNEMIISLRSSMGGRAQPGEPRVPADGPLNRCVAFNQTRTTSYPHPYHLLGPGLYISDQMYNIFFSFLLCVFQKILKNMNMETKKKDGSGINLNNDGWFILNYSNVDQLEGIMQVNGLIRERWWYYGGDERW